MYLSNLIEILQQDLRDNGDSILSEEDISNYIVIMKDEEEVKA
jgi:hypothetical protein